MTDSTGAAVPQAKITVTNVATNVALTTVSNDSGDYTLPNLPAGRYNASFAKEGFTSVAQNGITLNAAATARADAS